VCLAPPESQIHRENLQHLSSDTIFVRFSNLNLRAREAQSFLRKHSSLDQENHADAWSLAFFLLVESGCADCVDGQAVLAGYPAGRS